MQYYQQAFFNLKDKLLALYDEHESAAIAHELLEYITGLTKIQRLVNKSDQLSESQELLLSTSTAALLKGKPLQYVTGQCWFMGKLFAVNEHVLIPRPETEELVQLIVNKNKNHTDALKILDIGTGSGCIAIMLKMQLQNACITACDISTRALMMAAKNASDLSAEVDFVCLDFLEPKNWTCLDKYDVLVSNPPYIPESQQRMMHTNVKDYEPGLALFVLDNDPLLFYRTIAAFGKDHLADKGTIYCEIEQSYGEDCKKLFVTAGYSDVQVIKDMHMNDRMLFCSK